MTDLVEVERRGHVTVLALNRPDARNAVNAPLAVALGEAIEAADADSECRVVVITGRGPVFSAGMDLKSFEAGDRVALEGTNGWGFAGVVRHPIDKPVIAAVNGAALGGGLEIVLAADLVVAAEDASFGLPEVTRGLFAGAGGLLRLAQLLPPRIAAEVALTGRRFSPAEALAWGLVNRVVPSGSALEAAVTLAVEVAANAPLAVQATTRLLRDSLTENSWRDSAWERNSEEIARVFDSRDAREGALAFVEKRVPVWTGS